MPPRLTNVIRLDSMPLPKASYTVEGYLKDKPILTSVGIFEYRNPDDSVRRELRLPEEVFSTESLKSYKGKPVIITHDAGLINKNNVSDEQIGTILSNGIEDGEDVRAEIIIHDTDAMKDSGLKELSLGYNLDLDETPGVWHGQHYDAIQRNIRINHLALVHDARAGEQARLNLDGRDLKTLIGGKKMSKTLKKTRRYDGILSPDELAKAIEEYKARRKMADNTDADEEAEVEFEETKVPTRKAFEKPSKMAPAPIAEDEDDEPKELDKKVAFLKEKHDGRRDEEEETEDVEEMKDMLVRQDEDMEKLFDIIDTLLAERAFDEAEKEKAEEEIAEDEDDDEDWMKEDEDDDPEEDERNDVETKKAPYDDVDTVKHDEDEEFEDDKLYGCGKKDSDDEEFEEDEDDEEEDIIVKKNEKMNMDSVDKVVRQRIRLGMIGKMLNLDGLENMSIKKAKKKVIKKVRPGIHLDGKSDAYINAAFSCAVADAKARNHKGTDYQKRQMFNKDSKYSDNYNSSMTARQKMIDRHSYKEEN